MLHRRRPPTCRRRGNVFLSFSSEHHKKPEHPASVAIVLPLKTEHRVCVVRSVAILLDCWWSEESFPFGVSPRGYHFELLLIDFVVVMIQILQPPSLI